MSPAEERQRAPVVGDKAMEAIMLGALGCLCAELAEAGRAVCCCMWYRGERRPPADGCECECTNPLDHNQSGVGVAWVRWVSTENIAVPSRPARTGFGGCDTLGPEMLRVTLETGVYRCVDTGEPEEGLGCEEQTQVAANGAWDDRLIRDAVRCCGALDGRELRFERQFPVGPSGGCGGSAALWTVTLKA